MSLFSLAGKVALVTGAGRGIGRGVAEGMGAAGATVVCSARTRSQLDEAVAAIEAAGGKALAIDSIVEDLVTLREEGRDLIFVHGGAETTNEVAAALGHPPEFITSESGYTSRRTDRRTLEIFEMVYCGLLNKMWVEKLQQRGVNAVGLSGLDGRIFEGRHDKRPGRTEVTFIEFLVERRDGHAVC